MNACRVAIQDRAQSTRLESKGRSAGDPGRTSNPRDRAKGDGQDQVVEPQQQQPTPRQARRHPHQRGAVSGEPGCRAAAGKAASEGGHLLSRQEGRLVERPPADPVSGAEQATWRRRACRTFLWKVAPRLWPERHPGAAVAGLAVVPCWEQADLEEPDRQVLVGCPQEELS